uniref:Uncharacterized protein n=1 Tax=Parascaris univalens TaxID=6257 RepID=A0A915A6T3_PARUN
TFFPLVIPGVSPSTTKAVNAFEIGVFGSGSLLHKTKNQLAGPAFVIHIFEPLMTYSSPFFSHFVFTPATSEPAHGSVTAFTAMRGSSVIRPRNFFLMGSLAARINGVSAKSFTSNAVAMAAHP